MLHCYTSFANLLILPTSTLHHIAKSQNHFRETLKPNLLIFGAVTIPLTQRFVDRGTIQSGSSQWDPARRRESTAAPTLRRTPHGWATQISAALSAAKGRPWQAVSSDDWWVRKKLIMLSLFCDCDLLLSYIALSSLYVCIQFCRKTYLPCQKFLLPAVQGCSFQTSLSFRDLLNHRDHHARTRTGTSGTERKEPSRTQHCKAAPNLYLCWDPEACWEPTIYSRYQAIVQCPT